MISTTELFELEKVLKKLDKLHSSFDYLRISIASPERIKSWIERILPSGERIGEILKPDTVHFRTHEPVIGGLFCEQIFGPIKNWKCSCGFYNGFIVDKVCEYCHVEIVESRVRRYRMGYIDLGCPMPHIWYLKGAPSYLTLMLQIVNPLLKKREVEDIVYYRTRGFFPSFQEDKERKKLEEKNEFTSFLKGRKEKRPGFEIERLGGELLQAVLDSINVPLAIKNFRLFFEQENCRTSKTTREKNQKNFLRTLRILESFFATKTKLSWMILTLLPVLPPTLRPLVELENGQLVAADVNEAYRLIIVRNERLFSFRALYVPDLIVHQERKLIQEAVDSLIDNARVGKEKRLTLNDKPLKTLTEILEGKQGRFRQSLLGKRVDYSARSVIVVGPTLRLNQCGLPYQIGMELFKPFLIQDLLKTIFLDQSYSTKFANLILKKHKPLVWTLLTQLFQKHLVLLNRAPTLHRFGIQAFEPILVLGQAIHLHPLVCTGFNADFDGDQMAVHLPLYEASQLEIRTMMRPCFNVLSPANGEVILKPTQDMVIGCYYLTVMIQKNKQLLHKWFSTEQDALHAFYLKKLNVHTPILVRYKIDNLEFDIINNQLQIYTSKENFLFQKKEIIIHKIFPVNSLVEKFYLLTNIGIFIVHRTSLRDQKFFLTDFFLETSAGRLIFTLNYKEAIQHANQ